MGKVLFLGIPAYGHVNPTLGIIAELVKQGEEVVYFCTEEFRERIENTGAIFKSYGEFFENINLKNRAIGGSNINMEVVEGIFKLLISCSEKLIEGVLKQIKGIKFDCVGYAAAFPFGTTIAEILKIPSFSSFAVFATREEVMPKGFQELIKETFANNPMINEYKEISYRINEKYGVEMPALNNLFANRGDINFAYTSKDFVAHIENYDDSYKFIGPPIYDRKEDITGFPYKEIEGKKVIYISLGTVFSNFDLKLYDIFFKAFKDSDVVVVMTAYNTDLSGFDIPENFIVKNYISQTEILKYADAAITHSGMNSTNDLLFNNVPFVAIPLGADQPYMASRAAELGACISLDKDTLTPETLRESVNKVLQEPQYIENIKKINESFRECGGYKRAAEEVLKLKAKEIIQNV